MKIKIISEGTGRKSRVINIETGEVIEGVQKAIWTCEAGGIATAWIKMVNIPIDVKAGKIVDITDMGSETKKFKQI